MTSHSNHVRVAAVLFGINRFVDACFLADMFIQALLGYLDRKRNRWETRPRVTIMRYCKRWLVLDTLSVLPYDAMDPDSKPCQTQGTLMRACHLLTSCNIHVAADDQVCAMQFMCLLSNEQPCNKSQCDFIL